MNDETNRRNDPFDHFHQKKKLSQQQISRIFILFTNKQLCRANKEPRERRVMAPDCLNPTISPSSLESLIRKGYNP